MPTVRHRGKAIPFKIDRNNKANLSTQLADGFRRAILTGHYRPGDRLPSFPEIALQLGVSIRAPREAMKCLVAENLIRSRPRVGCEVLARGDRIWKGRVICAVAAALEGSYYFSMLIGDLRRGMVAQGYSLITVAVDARSSGELDFSQLDALCGEEVDCIITIHPPDALAAHIASYGVPAFAFVDVQTAVGLETLRRTDVCAIESVVRVIQRSGVKRVLLANYTAGQAETALLERFGLEVESLSVVADGPSFLEDIRRRSMEALLQRFAPKRPRPELVVFTDDHVAFGGLLALALRGVRVPEDISVITLSNRGAAPAWPQTLARIEVDPIADGNALAAYAVAKIEGRPAPTVSWRMRFIPGESFPYSIKSKQRRNP